MNRKTPSHPIKITFIPVKDDYIYVSRALTSSLDDRRPINYLYSVFLVLNAICFPAYLIFAGHPIIGLSIFAVNVLVFIILVPSNEKKENEKFYNKQFKDIGDHPLEVELTENGVLVSSDGDEGRMAWKNITSIQDSREVLYFFTDSSGIAVRKSAFESEEQRTMFMDTARYYHRLSRADPVEKQPVSAISP